MAGATLPPGGLTWAAILLCNLLWVGWCNQQTTLEWLERHFPQVGCSCVLLESTLEQADI